VWTPKRLGAKAAEEATIRANRRQKVFMVDIFREFCGIDDG
jgi:hypothetical protein